MHLPIDQLWDSCFWLSGLRLRNFCDWQLIGDLDRVSISQSAQFADVSLQWLWPSSEVSIRPVCHPFHMSYVMVCLYILIHTSMIIHVYWIAMFQQLRCTSHHHSSRSLAVAWEANAVAIVAVMMTWTWWPRMRKHIGKPKDKRFKGVSQTIGKP